MKGTRVSLGGVLTLHSSGGLEEYIEGYSFLYYLETGGLVSLPDLQQALSDEEGVKVSFRSLSSS